MARLEDLNNRVFGWLTIQGRAENCPRGGARWDCICRCGKQVTVDARHLKSGATISCGCYNQKSKKKHGMYGTPEYVVWGNMVQRCTNKNSPEYKNYGGRGIFVAEEWLVFENFFADMGKKPSEELSLERIDNEQGYSKENCKWATTQEQSLNKRLRGDNTSGYVGVYFDKRRDKWQAQIYRDGVNKFLGYFESKELANEARKKFVAEISSFKK